MKKILNDTFRSFGFEVIRSGKEKNSIIILNEEKYEIKFKNIFFGGDKYFLPKYALHRQAVKAFLNGNLQEPDTHKMVKQICSKRQGSIIHAGAFFGDMLPSFSKFVQGKVYAFEPVLENFVLGKLTIEANNLHNVILMNAALSDNISNLKIDTRDGNDNHAGGGSIISDTGQICTSLKIDNLEVSDIVLIQLDVEEHELVALNGALETIRRCRPVIAVEDNKKNCDNFFKNLNYRFVKKIPGLNIWVPEEDDDIFSLLK